MAHRTVRTIGLGSSALLLFVIATSAVACAPPPVAEEEMAATTSNLTGCELLASAAGASAAVAVSSLSATGTCAVGAATATVVSAGVAAAGSLVCLVPAGGAVLATITGLLAAGTTLLVCGGMQSEVESGAGAGVDAKDETDTSQCEGKDENNISANSASQCPKDKKDDRLDVVFCFPAFDKGPSDWTHPVDKSRWNCSGKSPHDPCYPSLANHDASHRHYYRIHYNFSAKKGCCFYQAIPDGVSCGPQNERL